MAGSESAHSCRWHPDAKSPEGMERTLCENKAVAILAQMQAGRPDLIQKNGGEMLIAIVLDRPLAEAKALVAAFTREMSTVEVPLWPPCLYHFFRPCLGAMRKHV